MLRANRLNPDKNPDLIVEGKVFDVYAPGSWSARNIADNVLKKTGHDQTQRVVVHLGDTNITRAQLEAAFREHPGSSKLTEVKTIDQAGRVGQVDLPPQRRDAP